MTMIYCIETLGDLGTQWGPNVDPWGPIDVDETEKIFPNARRSSIRMRHNAINHPQAITDLMGGIPTISKC